MAFLKLEQIDTTSQAVQGAQKHCDFLLSRLQEGVTIQLNELIHCFSKDCLFIKLSTYYMQEEKKTSSRIEWLSHPHSRPIILNYTAVLCGPLCLSATSPRKELQQSSP